MWAIYKNYSKIVNILLSNKDIKINQASKKGETAQTA